jgi:hypothetical protein
VHE